MSCLGGPCVSLPFLLDSITPPPSSPLLPRPHQHSAAGGWGGGGADILESQALAGRLLQKHSAILYERLCLHAVG